MDVYALAPALLSVGDLVRDANRFYNQDRATVTVQVESDFEHSSFDISLLVDQGIIEQAKQVLFGSNIDAQTLVELIFGQTIASKGIAGVAGAAIIGVVTVYKLLKGEKPSKVIILDESTTIVNDIRVEAKTAQLYSNDLIRSKLDGIVRPLGKQGIENLRIRKGKEVLEEIRKENLPDRVLPSSSTSSSEQVLTDTREALVKVVTANFEKGKWRFSDGNARFNAKLEDPVFQQKLDSGDAGFYKGDILKVKLTTIQTAKPDGKFRTDYTVEEVLDHRHIPDQSRLKK